MTCNFRVDGAEQNEVVNPSQWTPDKHSEEGEFEQSREQITDPGFDTQWVTSRKSHHGGARSSWSSPSARAAAAALAGSTRRRAVMYAAITCLGLLGTR